MTEKSWISCTRRELIIEVWEALDCESVGTRELEQIQQALRETFGEGGLESPASIARTVADEGAVLRHPEVFDCDSKWRGRMMSGAGPLKSLSFSDLADASESLRTLEIWRRKFADEGRAVELRRLQALALKVKQDLQLLARSRVVESKRRLEAGEIVQWLTIWMQDPAIFDDWLSLRRRSPEFVQQFPD
jgi:hypothetical protein